MDTINTKWFTDNVTLIIFTSEGREYLLEKSNASFKLFCNLKFRETLLGIDGPFNAITSEMIEPDIIIHHAKRQGYINNITTLLSNVKTPYFFWLEDDFLFKSEPPLMYMAQMLASKPNWSGIFLSRTAPLIKNEKYLHQFDNLYKPDFGFSVSPTLCNTNHVRSAFDALKVYPKKEVTRHYGFETFISDFFDENGFPFAVIDPGEVPQVEHIGQLESTGREHHMVDNLNKPNSAFMSGFQDVNLTIYNKFAMLVKLWISVASLSFDLFRKRHAYDFAFRIYLSFLRKFKY